MNIVKRHRHNDRQTALNRREEKSDLLSRFFDVWGFEPLADFGWAPAMDLTEKSGSMIARMELPGMKVDDISIEVRGNVLCVTGSRKDESRQHDENYYHVERIFGEFRREINLPREVDADRVEASYRDGLLTITMPESEKARARKISVKS